MARSKTGQGRPGRRTLWTLSASLGVALLAVVILRLALQRTDRPWDPSELRPGQWNVLLVSLDTTRPDPLVACGGSRVKTPGLDRVRGGGFVFSQMVTPVPVTLPAHASLMTGQYPFRHGVRENTEYALPEEEPTLAGAFRAAGYTTAAFVASFVLNARFGLNQGFDLYQDRLNGPEEGLGPTTVELPGAIVVSRAGKWISEYSSRRRRGEQTRPFFLFVHLFDAHAPYRPPAPFDQEYRDRPYDGELAYDDLCLGRLLDALEAGGESGRTLVWVISDHGESLGEHGESSHSLFIYDSTLRIVSILRPPPADGRYRAGAPRLIVTEQTGLCDLCPTLCSLAGVAPPTPRCDGMTLVPLMEGRSRTEAPVYCETLSPKVSFHWAPLFGIRTAEWKYIRAPEPELYNLKTDPMEKKNLAATHAVEMTRFGSDLDEILAGDVSGGPVASGGAGAGSVVGAGRSGTGSSAASASRTPSTEERERLRSLGYLSGSGTGDVGTAERLPDPKRMVAFFNQGYQDAKNLLYAGRFLEAAAAFRQALSIDPLNNSIHLYLAGALRQAGKLQEAERSYRSALEIEAHSPRAYFGWGQTFLAMGRADSAAWAFRRSLELLPGSPDSWSALGSALWRSGDLPRAREAYEKALVCGADPTYTHGTLVRLYNLVPMEPDRARTHLAAYARLLGLPPEAAGGRLPPEPIPAGSRERAEAPAE